MGKRGPSRGEADARVLAMVTGKPRPTQGQIAEALGITQQRVSQILKRANLEASPAMIDWEPAIAARRRARNERAARARELRGHGWAQQKIADALGVRVQAVGKYLKTKDL